jgi:hypothetical protein
MFIENVPLHIIQSHRGDMKTTPFSRKERARVRV